MPAKGSVGEFPITSMRISIHATSRTTAEVSATTQRPDIAVSLDSWKMPTVFSPCNLTTLVESLIIACAVEAGFGDIFMTAF